MFTIRPADHADVPGITRLASRVALSPEASDPAGSGFLVSGFTEAEYERFLDTAEHFCIALEGAALAGFILAYGPRSIDSTRRVDGMLKREYLDDFMLIKQIAVDPDHQRRGIGRRLYQHLIDRAPDRALLAAIVQAPINRASRRFHERLGFHHLLDVEGEDELMRSIWHRPAQRRARGGPFLRTRSPGHE